MGSCLGYVLAFRGVFCRRMSWRTSTEIGLSELATVFDNLEPDAVDAARGSDAPFDARIHDLRRHPGEISFPGGRQDDDETDLRLTLYGQLAHLTAA